MNGLFLLALAVAPGLALAVFIYWKDKFEREPLRWVGLAFFLGLPAAVLAALGSLGLTYILNSILHEDFWLYHVLDAFVAVALVEEFFKWLVLRLFIFRRSFFDEPFDGITYAVMVSLGFATIENVLYVYEGGLETALVRMFTAVPAHAVFGVMMGYYLGMARFYGLRRQYLFLALLAPVILHGFYDTSLFLKNIPFMFLGALASLAVGIWLSFRAIRLHQKRSPFDFGTSQN
ncbi:MAG: PrsW family glutamic-type intramembrane protease [Flavobacteriales bacterium]|nr:PrsW family glutamic-type intramembrane protease [Flavobacteriales bacterium]